MKAVGIITPTKERFDDWVKNWGIPQERYVFLLKCAEMRIR